MTELETKLLAVLKDAEEALSHVENTLHVRINPPTLDRMREAIAEAEATTQPDADGWIKRVMTWTTTADFNGGSSRANTNNF